MVAAVVPGVLALAGLGLWLRLLPGRGGRVGGVDAWFYLLYADAIRRQRRLPVRLRQFLLDTEEQCYPPVFPLLLAALPERVRLRGRGCVSPLIDVLQLAIVEVTALAVGMDTASVLLAGLIYAITPTLVFESSTLNSRSLGSFLLTATMLAVFGLLTYGGWGWIALASLAGAVVLLAHKMATQLLLLLLLGFALTTGRWQMPAVACLAVALAWVASGGFYRAVVRGHLDILHFWRKHRTDVNAHQVYDSPLYEGPRPANTVGRRLYGKGLGGLWRLGLVLVAHNPWALLMPGLLWLPPRDPFGAFLLEWAVLGYAAAIVTTFVGPLRFLGEGFKYLKFVAFPLSLLIGRELAAWPEILVGAPCLLLSLLALRRFQRARAFEAFDEDFERVIERLKGDPRDRVATIPSHRSDPIAYLADKQVLWGGHSAGFEKLGVWYPVIGGRIADVLDAHDVPLLLVDCLYVNPDDLGLDGGFRPLMRQGRFLLVERVPPRIAESTA